MVSTSYPPAVIADPRNQDLLLIIASQIPHDAGLAPVPFPGQNSLRKFLLLRDSNQHVSHSMEPRQDLQSITPLISREGTVGSYDDLG